MMNNLLHTNLIFIFLFFRNEMLYEVLFFNSIHEYLINCLKRQNIDFIVSVANLMLLLVLSNDTLMSCCF